MCCSYEKILLEADFKAQERERLLDTFPYQHELYSYNKIPTCYTNPNNPDNIDLTQNNCTKSVFQNGRNFHRSI